MCTRWADADRPAPGPGDVEVLEDDARRRRRRARRPTRRPARNQRAGRPGREPARPPPRRTGRCPRRCCCRRGRAAGAGRRPRSQATPGPHGVATIAATAAPRAKTTVAQTTTSRQRLAARPARTHGSSETTRTAQTTSVTRSSTAFGSPGRLEVADDLAHPGEAAQHPVEQEVGVEEGRDGADPDQQQGAPGRGRGRRSSGSSARVVLGGVLARRWLERASRTRMLAPSVGRLASPPAGRRCPPCATKRGGGRDGAGAHQDIRAQLLPRYTVRASTASTRAATTHRGDESGRTPRAVAGHPDALEDAGPSAEASARTARHDVRERPEHRDRRPRRGGRGASVAAVRGGGRGRSVGAATRRRSRIGRSPSVRIRSPPPLRAW